MLRILLIAVPISVAGCSINVKDIELPPRFIDNASEYNIAGTNVIFDDRHLNFGPYQTRKNKQGNREFQKSRSLYTEKKLASQEISFTMSNGNALRSNAEAVGLIFKESGSWLDVWLEDKWWYKSPVINYENYFAGTINIMGDKEYWFYIPQAYSSGGRIEDAVSGYIYSTDTNDTDALRIGSHKTQFEGVVWLQNTNAFLLYREENIIAALQASYPLKIWISNDASETDQFLAANLMGLMVFRQDLISN